MAGGQADVVLGVPIADGADKENKTRAGGCSFDGCDNNVTF